MRFGFVTCVQLGLSCMEAIYEVGGKLSVIFTLQDDLARNKSGRVYLDDFSVQHNVPLHKIKHINDGATYELLRAANLDWLFIVGWSQIAGSHVLTSARCGVLGMHPTLLPVGRGRAAIPWAILLGLEETGVTLFQLDAGVDTGPIVAQRRVPIGDRESATSLYEKVNRAHAQLLRENWSALERGDLSLKPQTEAAASIWPGRRPEDGRLRKEMGVVEADRMVRAVTHPYPGAFCEWEGRRLRIWETGAPSEDLVQEGALMRLQFADGWLDVKNATEEPL